MTFLPFEVGMRDLWEGSSRCEVTWRSEIPLPGQEKLVSFRKSELRALEQQLAEGEMLGRDYVRCACVP